jgi:hypothetical protein
MRVLLDECVPRKFKFALTGHDCRTVPEAGLAGKKNEELLVFAEQQGFEVFLTLDGGVPYQQTMTGRQLAVVIVRASSNRLQDLIPHVETCRKAIESPKPGSVTVIE